MIASGLDKHLPYSELAIKCLARALDKQIHDLWINPQSGVFELRAQVEREDEESE